MSSVLSRPHVTGPETWRPGVPEWVFIRAFQQPESFPVKVSLRSYPDKKTTFSSALLPLTPENRYQGAVQLSIKLEDFPGDFVYLLAESEVFTEETRIPVTSAPQDPMKDPDKADLKRRRRRRRRSVLTDPQIQEMISRYRNPNIQKCCRDGYDHYLRQSECKNGGSEDLKQSKPRCHLAYEECCNYTEAHMYKATVMAYSVPQVIQPIRGDTGGRQEEVIVITVTQTGSASRVVSTFTVKIDPTHDLSVQVSSNMFDTKIHVSVRTPRSVDGDL
ncbi:uncharacterized protein LOC142658931 [Rhinoderma darwinii]|uniref:uncharacterized protein LOC142658931 n=1 Tax=Rhinoderma darwinii TaxID=43563 RepID=UPI003F66D313